MSVLAIRFSGNNEQFGKFLEFLRAYGDMTVKELIETEYLLV